MKLRYHIARKRYVCDECRHEIFEGAEYCTFQWNGELRKVHANEYCDVNHPALAAFYADDAARVK